jgi:hypothetical protein
MTARGSDLNVMAHYDGLPGKCAGRLDVQLLNIAVSRSLADIIIGWGIEPSRVHVLRNGSIASASNRCLCPRHGRNWECRGGRCADGRQSGATEKGRPWRWITLGTLRATYPQPPC